MRLYTVEFVYSDESTPRDLYYSTVMAASAQDAETEVFVSNTLAGDRVMITGTLTTS